MVTALEQGREDAALGAAWRRAEASMPVGWRLGGLIQRGSTSNRWQAVALPYMARGVVGLGTTAGTVGHLEGETCPTPADALDSLAQMAADL